MKWLRDNITKLPSFSIFEKHVSTIEQTVETNPSLCVETCKSLIEGICKSILTNRGIDYAKFEKFQALVKGTILEMSSGIDTFQTEMSELSKRISPIVQYIAEIRNNNGFASHGQDLNMSMVPYSLALLCMKTTDVLCGFLLHFYITHTDKKDSRLRYEDLKEFNDYYDSGTPLQLNGIELSASLALFHQDYEAYKAEYYSYLDDIEKGIITEED